jgi:hypothetical protein
MGAIGRQFLRATFSKYFILLASPTVSTLNTVADVIRDSAPLYELCRSVLNDLPEIQP